MQRSINRFLIYTDSPRPWIAHLALWWHASLLVMLALDPATSTTSALRVLSSAGLDITVISLLLALTVASEAAGMIPSRRLFRPFLFFPASWMLLFSALGVLRTLLTGVTFSGLELSSLGSTWALNGLIVLLAAAHLLWLIDAFVGLPSLVRKAMP